MNRITLLLLSGLSLTLSLAGCGGGPVTCTAETDLSFCTRHNRSCGTLTTFDNCEKSRTVTCGEPCLVERPVDSGPGDAGGVQTDGGESDGGPVDCGPSDGGTDGGTPLTWGPCSTAGWPSDMRSPPADLQCTTITVPLDPSRPCGQTIDLNVARQKARQFPTGKAVFQVAGGPGGGSVWQAGTIPLILAGLRDTFDLIYVDHRGTGRSGYLDCSQGYPDSQQTWTACAGEHQTENLQHYLTTDAAQDLELVRERLGYAKMFLRGGSYGTRVGLEYLRLFESRVGGMVLDGVLPPDVDLFGTIMQSRDTAVAKLIADCSASPACLAVSPTLAADLDARRAALQAQPRSITVDGRPYQEDKELFEMFVAGALDWSGTYYRVPRAIHASVGGDNSLWNAVVSDAYGVTVRGTSDRFPRSPPQIGRPPMLQHNRLEWLGLSYVAPALFATVDCAEYLPNTTLPALETLASQQSWTEHVAGWLGFSRACASWNVSPVAAAVRAPVTSASKVLLLSGSIDLRTVPAWGARALQTLRNGTHLVIPYASHSTMSVPCASGIMTRYFMAEGDMANVDTSCIGRLTQPPW